jgi:hypothetical protein
MQEMATSFRVVDLQAGGIETIIEARSPAIAAEKVLGYQVYRSGSVACLVAKVYWQEKDEPLSMIRFYRPVATVETEKSPGRAAEA